MPRYINERDWMMLAAAALAGGQSYRQAAESADKLIDVVKSRFPEDEDEDKD
jgi:hypothetical protein